jgi:hypothetical protein
MYMDAFRAIDEKRKVREAPMLLSHYRVLAHPSLLFIIRAAHGGDGKNRLFGIILWDREPGLGLVRIINFAARQLRNRRAAEARQMPRNLKLPGNFLARGASYRNYNWRSCAKVMMARGSCGRLAGRDDGNSINIGSSSSCGS